MNHAATAQALARIYCTYVCSLGSKERIQNWRSFELQLLWGIFFFLKTFLLTNAV